MYELHEQVHQDRLQGADQEALRRGLVARRRAHRRARRRLQRAERAALQARLVLATGGEPPVARATGRQA